ncbi:MAG: 50S ribosomal protein L27 [Anaerolineae bacterium]|nr:50S ribosomal protein L27 [Anaerolineae bacterium]
MAHKKGGGSSRNGRDSNSQRLGIKRFGGEEVIPGNIIVRQRGNKFFPGVGADQGKDFTIFATAQGYVTFEYARGGKRVISVRPEKPGQPVPAEAPAEPTEA